MTDTPNDRTAIDTALLKLNLGCQYLEITRPSKQDVKKASEAAEAAAELLKASLVLLDHDCYSVQEAPKVSGTPLFKASGEPTKAAEVPTETGLRTVIDVELVPTRAFLVGDRVRLVLPPVASEFWMDEPGTGTVIDDDGGPEDESSYEVCDDSDGHSFYCSVEDITLVERPQDAATIVEVLTTGLPKGTKAVQKKAFEERLVVLESMFCNLEHDAGRPGALKAFKVHRDTWAAHWKESARNAWTMLGVTIVLAKLNHDFTAWAPEVAA